jgi:hypothetical protein
MNTTDIHPLQQAAELRLLADALELQHLTSTEASIRPIPMVRGEKAQRFIVIGAAAEVARLLEIAGARSAQAAPIQASSRDEVLEEAAEKLETQHTWITNVAAANIVRALRAESHSKSSDSKGGEA